MTCRYTTICVMVLLAVQCWAADARSQPRFEIYRVAIDDRDFPANALSEGGSKWCREHVTQDYLAEELRTVGRPLLTDADISEYCWSGQWLRLTEAAAASWNSATREHRSLAGEFFVVLVDDRFCYAGIIWNLESPQLPPAVPVLLDRAWNGVLMINVTGDMLGTPQDVRFDEHIKRAFTELGKLPVECAEDWWK